MTTLERIILSIVSLIILILSVIAIFLFQKSDEQTVFQPQSTSYAIFTRMGD